MGRTIALPRGDEEHGQGQASISSLFTTVRRTLKGDLYTVVEAEYV